MEYAKLPVAKRTRSGNEKFLRGKLKRFKSSGAGVPVQEADKIEHVLLDSDEGLQSDCDDLIVVEDFDVQKSQDDSLSNGDGSDIVVVSVIDKGEGREIERSVDHEEEEEEEVVVVAEDLDSSDSSSSSEDSLEDSDESYRGDDFVGLDHAQSSDDDSSSCAKSEDEVKKDCETELIDEMSDGKWKGKLVQGSGSKNYREKKETVDGRFKHKVETVEQVESSSFSDESDDEDGKEVCLLDDSDDEICSSRPETSAERKNGKRIVQNDSDHLVKSGSEKLSSRKDGLQKHSLVKLKGKWRIAEGGQRGNKNDKRKYEHVASDEGEDDFDDDEVKGRVWEKKDVQGKGKGKWWIAEGGQRGNKNDKRKHEHVEYRVKGKVDPFKFEELDSWDDMSSIKYGKSFCSVDVGNSKNGRNVGKKNEERTVKSGGLKKRTESRDVADHLHSRSFEKSFREKVNSSQDSRFYSEAEEVVEILSSSESIDESRKKFVERDSRERQKKLKMAAKRKASQNLDGLKILADSLHGKGEALKKLETEKSKHKFWFKDKEEEPVEKSDFDKHLDVLFEELNKCLAFEEIGYTPLEVDDGDHCKTQTTQTDSATLCSQGIHHLVLDEQIGIICKYCSHVNQEIKHILPNFSKPSPRTQRRGYFAESGCPVYSDDFRYTGVERRDFENYNPTGTVWDLVPGTRSSMYEHQREGFEFIWKNLAGGIIIEELEKPLLSSGSGCIISHAPGTGKTRLTIIFLQSFMKMYPDSRPVIIAPKSMLLTWEEELKKWKINVPFHNLNNMELSGQENPAAVSVSGKGRDSRNSETHTRLVKLYSWKMDKSILGITYALFDKLVRAETRNADCNPIVKRMGKALLKLPGLLVLDEGHTPRNDQSSIYNSLLDVQTQRRIILSGTPFQNNFDELYNTLRLVNPKFDGEMKKNLRNISKELKSKWSGPKLGELKVMISPFVHVHKGKILQKSCPGLKDALVRLQPTELQQELIGILSTNKMKAGYLELQYVTSLVSVHPSLLPERYFQEPQFSTYKNKLEKIERDPYSGAKTKFVVELCRLSEALNEKVLIYSQYIDPLMITKKQLQTYFGWTEGREVLYMDGALEAKQRQSLITSLNDPRSKARVLLASIKACSEGINLVGASRVVLLDVVWNPSVERQAISRAYRLGQKKMVYTYHLIGEEMDNKKYKVQTAKDRLSECVFSSDDIDSCKEKVPNIVSEDEILQQMFQNNDKLGGMFRQIIYQPKESNLVDTYDLVAEEPN